MRGKLLYAIFCSTFRYAFSNFVGIKGSRPQKKTEFYEMISLNGDTLPPRTDFMKSLGKASKRKKRF